jgi:hypothetical protein
VDQTEDEGDDPSAVVDNGFEIVEGGEEDGGGDDGFDKAGGEFDDLERSESEGDGMGQGEGGNYFQDVEKGEPATDGGFPGLVGALEDGGEEKGNEEEDVVVASPNVPHAFAKEVGEASSRLRDRQEKALGRLGWTEDGGFGASGEIEAKRPRWRGSTSLNRV